MKKSVIFFLVAIFAASNMKAQKAGILKIDEYGAFTGDNYLDFFNGQKAADFEKKSTITLPKYLKLLDSSVKVVLNEPDIASAVRNSTVKDFPADADVYTSDNMGNWKHRKPYAGEKGFYHEPTGIYWVSFKCGNPTAFKGKLPAVSNPGQPLTGNAGGNGTGALTGTTGLNLTLNTGNNQPELSWSAGYAVYSVGRQDRTNDMLADFTLMKMAMDAKQCCGSNAGQSVQTIGYVQQAPQVLYQQAQIAYPKEVYQMPRGSYRRGDHGWLFYASANAAGTLVGGIAEDLLERWIWGRDGQTQWENPDPGPGNGGGPIHIGG